MIVQSLLCISPMPQFSTCQLHLGKSKIALKKENFSYQPSGLGNPSKGHASRDNCFGNNPCFTYQYLPA